MIAELSVATLAVLATVLVHGAGLLGLSRVLKLEHRMYPEAVRSLPVSGMLLPTTLVLGLMTLHGIEIWLYGLLFWFLGAVPDLREAIYFSTITYATIGYDDHAIAPDWALVAAIEGINGVVLLGWSTAFFVTAITRLRH